jgi:hypothetical protein
VAMNGYRLRASRRLPLAKASEGFFPAIMTVFARNT